MYSLCKRNETPVSTCKFIAQLPYSLTFKKVFSKKMRTNSGTARISAAKSLQITEVLNVQHAALIFTSFLYTGWAKSRYTVIIFF
jgi:hypothetical protein